MRTHAPSAEGQAAQVNARRQGVTLPCANPQCSVDSLYFRNGSLHWIDVETSEGSSTAAVNQQIVWLRAEMRLRKRSFDTQNVGTSSQTVQPLRPFRSVIADRRQGCASYAPMVRLNAIGSPEHSKRLPLCPFRITHRRHIKPLYPLRPDDPT
jgi:hypothetical protein